MSLVRLKLSGCQRRLLLLGGQPHHCGKLVGLGTSGSPREETRLLGVMVRGHGLVLSIVHLLPLTVDSPFTFTVLIIFFTDTFRYVVW